MDDTVLDVDNDVQQTPKPQTRYQKDKARGKNTPCGLVDCPICNTPAPVFRRRDAVGRKYYNCQNCGQNYCIKDAGQKWLHDNMRALDAAPEKKPEPQPRQKPAPVVQETSILETARKIIIG